MKRIYFLGFWGIISGATSPIHATTFVMMDDTQVVQASKAVCFGEITDVRSEKVGNQELVQTVALFKPTECFKGNAPNPTRITYPGGTFTVKNKGLSRQIVQKVPGTPQLKTGDKGIFHLWWGGENSNQGVTVTSWQRGVMKMVYDKNLKDYREARSGKALQADQPKNQKNVKPAQPATATPAKTLRSYKEFVAKIPEKKSPQ